MCDHGTSRPSRWEAGIRPTLVTVFALLWVVLVAGVFQLLISRIAGLPLELPDSASRMPTSTFLLRALGTDAGLILAGFALFFARPGTLRLAVSRRDLLRSAMALLLLLGVNVLASWGMHLTGEEVGGFPEIPEGLGGLALVLAAGGLAPAAEEFFFREALLCRAFPRGSGALGLAVTSVAFGAMHLTSGGPLLFGALCVMGVVLGRLRLKTGSLGPVILVHAANNLSALLFAGGGP